MPGTELPFKTLNQLAMFQEQTKIRLHCLLIFLVGACFKVTLGGESFHFSVGRDALVKDVRARAVAVMGFRARCASLLAEGKDLEEWAKDPRGCRGCPSENPEFMLQCTSWRSPGLMEG